MANVGDGKSIEDQAKTNSEISLNEDDFVGLQKSATSSNLIILDDISSKNKSSLKPIDKKTNNNKQNKKVNKSNSPLLATSPKQLQGNYFEQLACEFLQQQGLQLIAQNWQQPKVGELDLVMLESGQAWRTLVFVEVRQRKRSGFGDAALSITASKQRKIIKTAQYFLQRHPEYTDYDCRFDVIAYNIDKVAVQPKGVIDKVDADTDVNTDTDTTRPNAVQALHTTANADLKATYQPEWLSNAFIAKAW